MRFRQYRPDRYYIDRFSDLLTSGRQVQVVSWWEFHRERLLATLFDPDRWDVRGPADNVLYETD